MSVGAALGLSLERLEAEAAAHERHRARELLDLLLVTNRAFNADRNAWREIQTALLDRTKHKPES